jgi:hypothetical protein
LATEPAARVRGKQDGDSVEGEDRVRTRRPRQLVIGACSYQVSADVYVEQFNAGPGSVRDLTPSEAQRMGIPLLGRTPAQDMVVVESVRDAGRGPRVPGWSLQAVWNIRERSGCAARQPLLMGFIQTAHRLRWEVRYDGLIQPFVMEATAARDAHVPDASIAPWMNVPDAQDGPVDAFGGVPAFLSDSPMAYLRAWGHQRERRHALRAVSMSAEFRIWLALRAASAPAANPASYGFVFSWVLVADRQWSTDDSDPLMHTSYRSNGYQRWTTQMQGGRGPHTPVLSGATANEQLRATRARWSLPG